MRRYPNWLIPFAFLTMAVFCLAGPKAPLASKPGVFETSREVVETSSRTVDITYVKPVKPRSPIFLVVFATGDGGWKDTSKAIFEHMAEREYYLAGFDSRPIVAPHKKPGNRISIPDAALAFEKAYTHAKRALGLPETTPVIATGESRGASMVVFVAGEKNIRKSMAGGVAIALTREADYIKAPDPVDRPAGMAVDSKGRIQLYPVLEHVGNIPFAVIQSTNDGYVPSEEARRLMGPDTPTRRLYEVKARNHSFSGGRDELLKDLDAALDWIEANAAAR